MAIDPPSPSAMSAAVRRHIADSLHDYADHAETSDDPIYGANSDVNRGIRFAAELVAGRIHNEHSPECGCPCDKPDPALLLAWDAPTRAEVDALVHVLKQAGLAHNTAVKVTRILLSAGYRTAVAPPTDPPATRTRRRDRVERPIKVAAYIQNVPTGPPMLRVPCWDCNRWYAYPAKGALPGDRVDVPVTCPRGLHKGLGVAPPPKFRRAVVQAVPFNPTWEYRARITNAYRAAVGVQPSQRSLRLRPLRGV